MIELNCVGASLPEAYHSALEKLYYYGDIVDCPAWETKCLEAALTMIVKSPLAEPRISRFFPGTPYDLEKYRQEMLDGIMDFKVGNGWNYTYHDRMTNAFYYDIDQIEFVIEELVRDRNSRRAVIMVRDIGEDTDSQDPACLQHIQFFIRNGKLDCMVLFRSNDLLEATFMNAYALICLQERIAGELGVEVGTYTHRANSAHVYEKDWDKLKAAVYRIEHESLDELSYCYAGDWDELMEAEKPRIAKFVEGLKNG